MNPPDQPHCSTSVAGQKMKRWQSNAAVRTTIHSEQTYVLENYVFVDRPHLKTFAAESLAAEGITKQMTKRHVIYRVLCDKSEY